MSCSRKFGYERKERQCFDERTLHDYRSADRCGQIATSNEIENYPGIPLLSGAELGERFQQHAEGLGARVEWSMVTGIDYDADSALFTVHHDMGDTAARSVIACMGATPRPAGFVGEDTYRGRGVSY